MWLSHVSEGEAEGVIREIYDRSRLGESQPTDRPSEDSVPEIVKSTSLRAEATRLRMELARVVTFGGSQLGRRREEMIATLVSVLNRSPYVAISHGEILRNVTGDSELPLVIARDWRSATSLDDTDRAILEFAEMVALRPSEIEDADIERLRESGLNDEMIVDVILATAYRDFITRIAHASGCGRDVLWRAADAKMAEQLEALANGNPELPDVADTPEP